MSKIDDALVILIGAGIGAFIGGAVAASDRKLDGILGGAGIGGAAGVIALAGVD
jgi:hypothetical protein